MKPMRNRFATSACAYSKAATKLSSGLRRELTEEPKRKSVAESRVRRKKKGCRSTGVLGLLPVVVDERERMERKVWRWTSSLLREEIRLRVKEGRISV